MTLDRSSPAAERIDARGILALLDDLDREPIEMHSIAIARHGRLVAEGYWAPYAADRPQLLYSVSKVFVATAVGILVDDGRLDLDAPVVTLLPGLDPDTVTSRWRDVTLRHCLTMATGHDVEAWGVAQDRAVHRTEPTDGLDPVLAAILAHEPEHAPGTHFAYNQVATYLVSCAIRVVTGGSLVDVLRTRVLEPLGIDDLPWHTTALGTELGFTGAHARTRDVAALGQLYLAEGRYAGRQLLSPRWVHTARAPTGLPNPTGDGHDWRLGYGCALWRNRYGYRGDGAFGQFVVVVPEADLVVAVTAELPVMQDVLDALWRHVLPAVDGPGSPADDRQLAERLASLSHPPLSSSGPSPPSSQPIRLSGTLPDGYAGVDLAPTPDGAMLTLARHGIPLVTRIGDGRWVESAWEADGWRLPVVASGGWRADGGYDAVLRIVDTPHSLRLGVDPAGTTDVGWRMEPIGGPDPLHLAVRRR